jgi:hypothetical protein
LVILSKFKKIYNFFNKTKEIKPEIMNRYAKKNHKIICVTLFIGPTNEYDTDIANMYLEIGKIYTIDYIDLVAMGSWEDEVYLQEFPNFPFS